MKSPQPPQWALRLLAWFCPPGLYEGIEGDLVEQFENNAHHKGIRKANQKFIWQVLLFFRPGILLRNKLKTTCMNTILWNSYLKVGWRNIVKHRFYSVINVVGLACGIAFALMAFLYVQSELRFDSFHKNGDRIFRVLQTTIALPSGEDQETSPVTSIPYGQSLIENYKSVESFTRFGSFSGLIEKDEELISQVITIADPAFFSVFDFPVLKGNKSSVLTNLSDVVLSEKGSETYFGQEDPIGKEMAILLGDSLHLFSVVAVVDNHTEESSLAFDVLIPIANYRTIVGAEVFESDKYGIVETFVLLGDPAHAADIVASVNAKNLQVSEEAKATRSIKDHFQPLAELHLNDSFAAGISQIGNPIYVYMLSGLGVLVLFMACINFITLTSGHALDRVKESGIRKTMGAFRFQIRNQLISESLLMCILASLVGFGFAYLAIPLFNSLVNATLVFEFQGVTILFLAGVIVLITILAGGVPARNLMRLDPVVALKKGNVMGRQGLLKNGLVLIQFTLSIMLLIGTFVMREQMDFISSKNLGFEKEHLYEISLNNPANDEDATGFVNLFKSTVASDSRIVGVTATMNDFQEPWTALGFPQEDGTALTLFFNKVEPDYVRTMGMEILQGRDFDRNANPETSTQILVNEALVKMFEWENPLNMQIPGKNFEESHEIIGVVKDFHFSSLHSSIEPMMLVLNFDAVSSGVAGLSTYRWPPMYNRLIIKIGKGELPPVVESLEKTWKEINPSAPFVGNFVDESIEALYVNEVRWKKIVQYGSLFTFGIAILGLVGLVKLLLQRKVKEIGIRKVLGSGFGSLVAHFSKSFVGILVVANLVAWPIAWWAGNQWLQSFPYRIELTVIPFLVAMLVVGVVVALVFGYLTWVASLARPVDVLKSE